MNNRNIKPISPFVLFCQKVIPLAFDESMSYYECLCSLVNYLYNEVTPAVNNNADAVTELQEYVANYFNNLDVQQEINNKLDDMAESGQLADIIAQYIQLAGVLAYNTVNDLINAENIVNDSITRTLGLNTYNDGKGAYYKIRTITSSDVVDGVNIIALDVSDTLIAEKIPDYYINQLNNSVTQLNNRVNQLNEFFDYDIIVDINGDGDYTSLATAVNNASNGNKIYVKKGTYNGEIVNAIGKNLTIVGENKDNTIIQNNLDVRNQAPISMTKGYVENITFKSTGNITDNDHAYAGHFDDNDSENSNLTFKNCYFSSVSNSAVGIGLRPNSNLKFIDCEFYTSFTPFNTNLGCFFIHNSADASHYGSNQNCYIENCKINSANGSAIHMQSCGPDTNIGYLTIQNSNLYSETYKNGNITHSLITTDLFVTATSQTMKLSNKCNGNGNPIANYSLYNTTDAQIIGKFINDQVDYPIFRKVYSYQITAGTELHLTLPTNYREMHNLYGKVVNTNFSFPLNMYLDGNSYVNAFIDEGVGRINVNSSISGTCLVILEYAE